jgi:hypothetical protein
MLKAVPNWIVLVCAALLVAVISGMVVFWVMAAETMKDEEAYMNSNGALQTQIQDLRTVIDDLRADAEPADIKNPKLYENEEFGFSFSYPGDNTTVEWVKVSGQPDYARIQNYTNENDGRGLKREEFYVEMYVFDKSEEQETWTACAEKIPEGSSRMIGERSVREGHVQIGGDTGGYPFELCSEGEDFDVTIRVTEVSALGPIANQIFDSVRFLGNK